MGSCCSCPDTHSLSDHHHSKFKVINVDDDGNELGSGVMELTDEELILHTRRREPVNWPYLCLRRYGCDSDLFSFESGRRCQTGQGIFAFKCVRAEEIFNMLQETMHNNSISVVEEAVLEPGQGTLEPDAPRTPRTPTTPGYSVPTVANGIARYPSFGEASSRPSSRHPSIGSARLPSVGEEATHPLLVTDDPVHTYVNTLGVQEDRRSRSCSHTPLELWPPNPENSSTTPATTANQGTEAEPQVVLEGECVKFVLGPTPVQRQKQRLVGDRETGPGPGGMEPGAGVGAGAGGIEDGAGQKDKGREPGSGRGNDSLELNSSNDGVTQSAECDTGYDSDERKDAPPPPPLPPQSIAKLSYEHHNGTNHVSTPAPFSMLNHAPRRNRPALPSPDFSHNANNSAQRRTALLNYENLPSLPPVWETPKRFSAGEEEEDDEEDEDEESYGRPKTLNGYHRHLHHRPHHHHHPLQHPLLDPMHNYVNTENVTMPLSAKLDSVRLPRREGGGGGGAGTPTVFNFDFRGAGGLDPLRQLNYIEVEMEKGSDSSGPHTPKTPTSPLLGPPPPPARRTELYAVIDIERTAAMSSLQKALPRDDGTSRKTRHNSTDLPM